jgi:hypothetical protein
VRIKDIVPFLFIKQACLLLYQVLSLGIVYMGGVERVLFLPNLLMKIFNYVPSLIHLVMKSK